MAISNTNILIKRSTTTGIPGSLKSGELAYSYLSNTLFLGTIAGNGVVNVGGQYYTSTLDAATQSNTASTLVKRDSNGAFFGRLYGDANTADIITNAQNFGIGGGDMYAANVIFNGSGGVTLNASLNTVPGLVAGYYGGVTQGTSILPIVQVAANGRIMSIANTTVSNNFKISDTVNSNTVYSGATLEFVNGTTGIVPTVTANTVTFNTDNTVVRSNTATVGTQTIGTNLQISGNLIVQGTQFVIDSQTISTQGSLIELAANNTVGDVVDIGFYGQYNNGTGNVITGLVRDAGNKGYYLFNNLNYTGNITGNVISNNYFTAANTSTLYANLIAPQANASSANITTASIGTLTLTNPLAVTSGGTGQNSFQTGSIIVGSGTGALSTLANSTFANTGTYGLNSTLIGLQVDAYGRTISAAYAPINGLTVTQGGTGVNTFASGQMLIGAGANPVGSLANVALANTGTYGLNSTLIGFTADAWGRATSVTYAPISGLTVPQGGTGLNFATVNGITYGNGTGALGVTAVAGSADQAYSNQILTVTNTGVPTWTQFLDGGQF
jgi:hypothetical protein